MSSDALPVAVWSGTFAVFGVTLRCYVLDDGRRTIHADDMQAFMAALEDGATGDAAELSAFVRWQRGLN